MPESDRKLKLQVQLQPDASAMALWKRAIASAKSTGLSSHTGELAGAATAVTTVRGMQGGLDLAGAGLDMASIGMLKRFVEAADPSAVEAFDQALEDITGVVGQALAPAFEILVPWVRTLGDFLASAMPDASVFRELFKAVTPLMKAYTDVMKSLAPILHTVLVPAIQIAAKVVGAFAQIVATAIEAISEGIKSLTSGKGNAVMLGLDAFFGGKGEESKEGKFAKSSVGASVRGGVSRVDVAGLGMQAREAAFGAMRPEEETAKNTGEMAKFLERWNKHLNDVAEAMDPDGTGRAITGLAGN